jgi:GT2 family glycosyltransferase
MNECNILIIIVNYNTSEHLKECLNSIFLYSKGFTLKIIVVDNKSTDREIEKLPTLFPNVIFNFRDVNDGFGSGCNYGANLSKGKYIAFVNPDIIIKDNVFHNLYKYMEENTDVGMCSGTFYDFNGVIRHTFSKFPGIYSEFLEAKGRGTHKRLNKFIESEKIKGDEPFDVDWSTGACMFFRKDNFDEINGFDKDFFLYYEDVDIQYRLKKAGYRIKCLPLTKIYHSSNSSIQSYEGENIYFYNLHRSKMIYFYKHFNFFKRNFIRLMLIFGVLIRFIVLNMRSSLSGKKEQKMFQYRKMLKVYFSNKNKLFRSTGTF